MSSLKPEHEQFIQSQIAAGKFANANEVIDEALRLLAEREYRLNELRKKVEVGTEQIINGQISDGEVVFARLQEKLNHIANKA